MRLSIEAPVIFHDGAAAGGTKLFRRFRLQMRAESQKINNCS